MVAALLIIAFASLSGTVTERGRPVPGAGVSIRTALGTQRVVTDAKGAFEATLLAPGPATIVPCRPGSVFEERGLELREGVRALVNFDGEPLHSAAGFVVCLRDPPLPPPPTKEARERDAFAGPRPKAPLGRPLRVHRIQALESGARASIEGNVVRPDGSAVTGATIQLRFSGELPALAEASTAGGGAFAFHDLVPASYDLEVHGGPSVGVSRGVTPAPGQTQRVEVQVEFPGSGSISGVVRRPDGSVVGNALVEGWVLSDEGARPRPPVMHTDARGRFELKLDSTLHHGVRVDAHAPGWSGTGVTAALDRATELEVMLDLEPSAGCRGVVRRADGTPAAGATVLSFWSRTRGAPMGVALTDESGRFAVTAGSDGFAVLSARLHGELASGTCPGSADLMLSPGATLRGRFLGGSQRLIIHSLLVADRENGFFPRRQPQPRTAFEIEGHRFSLPNLPVGEPFDLWFNGDGPVSVELPGPGLWELDDLR